MVQFVLEFGCAGAVLCALLVLVRAIENRDEGRMVYGASLALVAALLFVTMGWCWCSL